MKADTFTWIMLGVAIGYVIGVWTISIALRLEGIL